MIVRIVAFAVVLVIGVMSIKIIRPHEKGVVERLGKYVKTADSGVLFVIPLIDRMIKVDMREKMLKGVVESVTADDVSVKARAAVYYKVTDPVKVIYNVTHFNRVFSNLVETTLKNLASDQTLKSLESRRTTAAELQRMLNDALEEWGVEVTKAEFEEVEQR